VRRLSSFASLGQRLIEHCYLITQAQYSELVTVVILSAFVPTLIAQQFFQPRVQEDEAEVAGELDAGLRTRPGSVRRG
jgi:hypothetical protein